MSTSRGIRLGTVSSVNAARGAVSVTYSGLDNNTTVDLPVLSLTDEYKMPQVGDTVIVLHLPDGAAAGVVLGRIWNDDNVCQHTGETAFRKELDHQYGRAFLDYDDSTGVLTIQAPSIRIIGSDATITINSADSMSLSSGSATSMSASAVSINTSAVTNTGVYTSPQDVIGSGISLVGHTHTGTHGETSGPH